jgi:GYF domain 2
MPERSWFFAAGGQQQGPYPEAQFRDFIARGAVTPDTLVWSEGMAGWQKAGEIPGLLASAGGPPPLRQSGGAVMAGGHGGSLSIDFGIWDFIWRGIVLFLGLITVIPAPWALVWYMKWLVSCVHVPGRPNMSFVGNAMTLVPWYFGFIVLVILVAWLGSSALGNLLSLAQIALYWLFLRWFVANLASSGQPLGLSFSGSFWAYLGWTVLTVLSFITIIGWAWVYAAQVRWICRNIQGTRRQVLFKGTGLQYLWRVIVALLLSALIIPIPWVWRWMMRWQLSQTELAERNAYAAA